MQRWMASHDIIYLPILLPTPPMQTYTLPSLHSPLTTLSPHYTLPSLHSPLTTLSPHYTLPSLHSTHSPSLHSLSPHYTLPLTTHTHTLFTLFHLQSEVQCPDGEVDSLGVCLAHRAQKVEDMNSLPPH